MNKDKTLEIGESIKTKFENFAGIEKLEGLSLVGSSPMFSSVIRRQKLKE